MRTVFVLASTLLSGSALADTVRHPSVPERLWGTWAPTAELCRDDKSVIIVSAKGYVTAQASCMVQWVIATAGAGGANLLRPYALLEPLHARTEDGIESDHRAD
jgi:hypothetical protein